MRVINDVRSVAERIEKVVLTIGCFDGVHLGHQLILRKVLEEACAMDGVPAVMTLDPHPRRFFFPDNTPNILTDNPLKERLLAEQGVAVLYKLPFDATAADMTPQEFVEQLIVERCRAATVVVGHDFAFGRRAEGDFEFLARAAGRFGFRAVQMSPLTIGGQRVSSTLIRERVVQGEVEGLEHLLGRPFLLSGKVTPGRGIGKTLGFPTANLDTGPCAVPAHGVYAAQAVVNGSAYAAAVNIGIAPTIRNAVSLVEAHLLDFRGEITGENMELAFYKRLRPEKKFASRDDLMDAIAADVDAIRCYFS